MSDWKNRALVAEAKLSQIKSQEPVAWAMKREDGLVLDVICPDEHDSHGGEYTVPLFLAAGAQTIPAGYQLVPVEPTMAIRMAYTNATYDDSESTEARNVWAAMLAAAKEQS